MSEQLDIRSLSVDEAAELLGLSADMVKTHITRSLPLRKDRRVDLVVYAAWLNTDQAKMEADGAGA